MNPDEIAASTAVTALFVPGSRPERFATAVASGADLVIIDLEDAVAISAKAKARAATVQALNATASDGGVRALVRISAPGSHEYDADIAALLDGGIPAGLVGVMLAKAENGDDVDNLRRLLPSGLELVPLVETARGLREVDAIAAVPGVTRLAFGAIDFALDINSSNEDEFLAYARSTLVIASRAARIAAPFDSPFTNITDTVALSASAALARSFGFGGKLCIHPAQVQGVAAAFSPTEHETRWARAVLSADQDAGGSAVQVKGAMVDVPVVERARRILRMAGQEL